MNFECDSMAFAKAANAVARTVSNKSSMISLEGILIEARNGEIKLTGYDMDVGTVTTLEANVSREGAVIINAKYLCDILRVLPGETVSFSSAESYSVKIQSGSAKYTIIGSNPDDFPDLPYVSDENMISIKQGVLKDMIRRVIFAVSTSERNPVHCGVKFEIENGRITLVAVDGSRLSIRKSEIEYSGSPISFVVPAKALNEIMKLSDGDDNDYLISIAPRHICVKTGSYTTISRLLEGNFIEYNNAIPKSYSTRVKVAVDDIAESIEHTAPIITDRASPIKLNINENVMKFSCVTSIGTASDSLAADIEGENLEIGFNCRYFLDALKAISDTDVKIDFGNSTQPVLIQPLEGDDYLYLVLPVRI